MHVHIHVCMYTQVGVSFWALIVLDLTDFGSGLPMGVVGEQLYPSPLLRRDSVQGPSRRHV